jgi:hypothetical protein
VVAQLAAYCGHQPLALHWAHRVKSRFPDGVLFADLHGYCDDDRAAEPGTVLDFFLRSLGVGSAGIPEAIDARAAYFRSLVAERRMLIFLDNAASAAQVRALLPASAGCLVLITSRSRLAGMSVLHAARRIDVGPLTVQDSTDLLRRVIGADGLGEHPDVVAQLAAYCGHQPLALRIAAFRIASRPGIHLADLLEELKSEHDRLAALDAGDQATAVRRALSCSYRALPTPAARLFGTLGLHPGGPLTAGLIGALYGESLPDTQVQLRRLTDLHMVEEIGPDRYRMPDLLRLYASECASATITSAEQDRAVRRMFDWYLHTAMAADVAIAPRDERWCPPTDGDPAWPPDRFGTAQAALRWCDDMVNSLVAVCRRALELKFLTVAWGLPLAVSAYLRLRRPRCAWISVHEIGLRAAKLDNNEVAAGRLLHNLATAYYQLNLPQRAVELYAEAMSLRLQPGET